MRRIIREDFGTSQTLTLCRIAAMPFVMLLIWRGAPKDCVLAAWAYSLAAATDYERLVGTKMESSDPMGRLLDPPLTN